MAPLVSGKSRHPRNLFWKVLSFSAKWHKQIQVKHCCCLLSTNVSHFLVMPLKHGFHLEIRYCARTSVCWRYACIEMGGKMLICYAWVTKLCLQGPKEKKRNSNIWKNLKKPNQPWANRFLLQLLHISRISRTQLPPIYLSTFLGEMKPRRRQTAALEPRLKCTCKNGF